MSLSLGCRNSFIIQFIESFEILLFLTFRVRLWQLGVFWRFLIITWNPRSPILQLFRLNSVNCSFIKISMLNLDILCSISENVLGFYTNCFFFFNSSSFFFFLFSRVSLSSESCWEESSSELYDTFLGLFLLLDRVWCAPQPSFYSWFWPLNLFIIELKLSLNWLPLKSKLFNGKFCLE